MGLCEARFLLMRKAPYFGPLLYSLKYVKDHRIRTLGVTDSLVLVYNEDFVYKHTDTQIAALLWHELQHLVHTTVYATQIHNVSHELLNKAADLSINSCGKKEGWELPRSGLFPEDFGFPELKSTPEYLEMLQQNPPPPSSGEDKSAEDGSGDEKGEGCGHGDCHPQGELKKELEEKYGKPGISKEAAVRQVAEDAARRASDKPGSVPGSMLTLLNLIPKTSSVDWRATLRQTLHGLLSSSGDNAQDTYAKPHRRAFLDNGEIILPGVQRYVTDVTLVVDTSGSMDEELLEACMVEVVALLEGLGLDDVEFIEADTHIRHKKWVSFQDLSPPYTIHGGGGTSFEQPLQELTQEGGRPLVIYLTDGYGPFGNPPNFPVFWAIFTNVVPPWGPYVHIKAQTAQ